MTKPDFYLYSITENRWYTITGERVNYTFENDKPNMTLAEFYASKPGEYGELLTIQQARAVFGIWDLKEGLYSSAEYIHRYYERGRM